MFCHKASVELQGIKGMWSLRSSIDDPFDTFLVVSFTSETRIIAMNLEDELEETEIEGFCSQVTSNSVRLVSSTTRELRNEWHAPSGFSVNVATANATQGNASGGERARHTGKLANELIDAAWGFIERKSVLPQHPPSGSCSLNIMGSCMQFSSHILLL
ncbi:hypothetical protein RIF29_10756 [Crotalaria pallida]|uniref:RSE1/DDB1/CPSF1 second beta-propeller domain-containing protein n=1 Tax=Crotalaria pallida TaxID=3830 RepID=A0AAN9G0A2_CROPI